MSKASIFLPVRNEEGYIERCLDSLLDQDYSGEYEIVVADGNSDDGTRSILEKYSEKHDEVRLFDNPKEDVYEGKKMAYEKSSGGYLVAFVGHAFAENDFLSTLIDRLERADDDVVAVGCGHEVPEDESTLGKSIGKVMNSLLGGVGTTFRNPDEEQVVDSLAFLAYDREKVEEAGGPCNPEFRKSGNDAEFNLRLNEMGYKIIYTPETKVYHYKRDSLSGFFRWIYNYGLGREKIIEKHGLNSYIYLGPSGMVLGSVFLLTLSVISGIFSVIFGICVLAYLISVVSSSVVVSGSIPETLYSVLLYPLEHFGYGLGFLSGVLGGDFL